MSREVHVVDSHTEGNPTRVVVGGVPVPPGDSVAERQRWVMDHDDTLRTLLNFEPRGNPMMCSVLLMPPVAATSHFSVLLMEQDEYVPMCGHCIIGAATTVAAEGMVPTGGDVTTVRFDTIAGTVTCEIDTRGGLVGAVSLVNVASFLLHRDATVTVEGLGELSVDVAFGGDFYAIVDADAAGLRVDRTTEAKLGAAARGIVDAISRQLDVRHPERPEVDRLYEVLFATSSPQPRRFRHAVVSPPGVFDRSPCGTGTSARLAALHARGRIVTGESYEFEGVLGTVFKGQAVAEGLVGGIPSITPRVSGRAYVTARSTLVVQDHDPFPGGYRVGPPPRTFGGTP